MLRSMQNSISCDESILQSTQLCNHNLSPFVGDAAAHLNKVDHNSWISQYKWIDVEF